MAKDFSTMDDCNPSHNQSIHDLSNPLRRTILRVVLRQPSVVCLHPLGAVSLGGCSTTPTGIGPMLGFKSVAMNDLDTVTVPDGYRVQVLYRWGDAVGIAGNMPAYKSDASNTATEQEAQAGMHHDGIHYFRSMTASGLLVMNHEYTDDGLLHVGGMQNWSAERLPRRRPRWAYR